MSSEIVNIRVHYGNGFIDYCDSGVDLSQFQYVDTTVTNPLYMRHADLLSWMHNFLQVDPSQWTIKVSGVVPRHHEHGCQWELCELSNSKSWHALVHMATNKMKFPLVVLVEQQLANKTQGESSHAVPAAEVFAETDCPTENSIVEDQQSQPEVDQQAKHETEGGDWEFGGHIIADQGELDETIVDQRRGVQNLCLR